MIQALPLVESGAADAAGLHPEDLTLACASHQGAPVHVARVARWIHALGLSEGDLRCGAQPSRDAAHPAARRHLGGPITNWRGIATGEIALAPGFA